VTLGIVLLAAGVTSAIVAGYRAVTVDLRFKRRVRRIAVTPIAELQDGDLAKIIGRAARADKSVEAPLSATECFYAHAYLEEYREGADIGGVRGHVWFDAGQSFVSCDFWLEDESGRAFVKLEGDVEVVPMFELSHHQRFAESRQRGQEVAVRDGDTLTVVGRVSRSGLDKDSAPFRSSGKPSIVISGTSSSPIFLCRD